MAFTYSKLAEVNVGSGGVAAITFNNIPQNYNDLVIYTSLRIGGAPAVWGIARCKLQINSITAGYSNRLLYTGGSGSPGSDVGTDQITFFYTNASDSTANTFSNVQLYLPNYSGNTNKSVSIDSVTESNNSGQTILDFNAALLSNTTTINSLSITQADGFSFLQYSTATLYGVKAEV